jgi:hypothetical protein
MSLPNPSLARLPALAVLAGLLCAQGACSLKSLDYLTNGQRHDDATLVSVDADIERQARIDALGFDAVAWDDMVQGGAGGTGGTGGTTGGTGGWRGTAGTSGTNASEWDGGQSDVGVTTDVEADLPTADDTTDEVPVSGVEDSGADDTPDAGVSLDYGDSVAGEAGTLEASPGLGPDLSTGGVTGTGGTGGSGGNGDARGGEGGSSGADAGAADTNNACAGLGVGGICWYLGAQGWSCQQFCASHGQPAPAAATYVGSTHQGGGILKCAILLGLLGVSGTPQTGSRTDGLGFGCHLFVQDGSTYWLSSPDFSVTASGATARLVCGCTQ